jgi:hypothetical protein
MGDYILHARLAWHRVTAKLQPCIKYIIPDETKLKQARDFAVSEGGGSGFITRGGKLVMSWGSPSQRYDLKSTTESIGVTALGLAVSETLLIATNRQDGSMR